MLKDYEIDNSALETDILKVILFDVDNTILSFDEYVKESMKNGFEKYKIGIYKEEMFSVFKQINTALWELIEKGELDFEELKKSVGI